MSSLFFVELATVPLRKNATYILDAEMWFPRCPSAAEGIPRLIPHLYDCRRLFICSYGAAIEYICPKDEVFIVKQQKCEKQAKCNKG